MLASCALCGACAAIVVPLALVIGRDYSGFAPTAYRDPQIAMEWSGDYRPGFALIEVTANGGNGIGQTRQLPSYFVAFLAQQGDEGYSAAMAYSYGWPWRSMYFINLWVERQGPAVTRRGLRVAVPGRHRAAGQIDLVIPLGVAVQPMLLNTVFYGAVFLCLAAIWRVARESAARAQRRNRLQKAECPNCEYSLRGIESDRCPECGSSISASEPVASHRTCGEQ